MSINTVIKSAVEPIVPVCVPDSYGGEETTYCTFAYSEIPGEFADDAPQVIRYLIQIHLFLPAGENPIKRKKQIAGSLFSAGFGYPEIQNASEPDVQHYVFECEYAEGEAGGET